MRTARPLGLSPDGRSLIVVLDGGEQVAIAADDRLRAALRNDRARMGQLEIEMDSALRPRDIQARIRAGESLEAVAQAAGVPAEQIEPFAAPVIAEREHIAGLAQAAPVRRPGDAVAHRSLRSVITDRLLSRGVDVDTVDWDAWRSGERRWTVRLAYESGSAHRSAEFTYDQTGRFCVAANDDARWLTGEQSSSHGPQPGRKRREDGGADDPTLDLNDELAIVRAIQPQFSVTPDVAEDLDDPAEREDTTPDNEDAFAEGDLEEVDGVYDIVPGDRSNLDVLYDMLSSFDEDSVQIYAGLVRPAATDAPAPVVPDAPSASADRPVGDDAGPPAGEVIAEDDAAFAGAQIVRSDDADEPFSDDPGEPSSGPKNQPDEAVPAELPDPAGAPLEAPAEPEQDPLVEPVETPAPLVEPAPDQTPPASEPVVTPHPADEPAEPADGGDGSGNGPVPEPEQPRLVDAGGAEPSRPIKRKRASVPSWDEIMFGAPKPKG